MDNTLFECREKKKKKLFTDHFSVAGVQRGVGECKNIGWKVQINLGSAGASERGVHVGGGRRPLA